MFGEKVIMDLYDNMMVDTYLSVKIGDKFVHYIVKVNRKDGSVRTYGDLYLYFTTKKPTFRMALGYFLEEDESGKFWLGQRQYMYFDRNKPPELLPKIRELKSPLIFEKRSWELV